MPDYAPSLDLPNGSVGIDLAIGQIDLIGSSGEVVKSWRIRKPRCTIGSSPDCNVRLTSTEIAPLHATLVFGKTHTLLRSVGPTLISKRHVREWLIDESTEIVIGQSRLVVHPSNCIQASVVHAEDLTVQASRLGKAPAPVRFLDSPQPVDEFEGENPTLGSAVIEEDFSTIPAARFDAIERLLESLKLSLEKMQDSIGTEAKSSGESIVQSVTLEIDEFGKRLFTDLNKQLSNQTDVQETLLNGIADQFSGRFGAIAEQLNRFHESSEFQTSTLNELLAQAASDQHQIETRFQDLLVHRNEWMDAVQVLRTEILIATSPERSSSSSAQRNDALPFAGAEYAYARSGDSLEAPPSTPAVSDERLAHSLELAQIQIQELNAQLRNMEIERDAAEQRVASLSGAWPFHQDPSSAPTDSSDNPIMGEAANGYSVNGYASDGYGANGYATGVSQETPSEWTHESSFERAIENPPASEAMPSEFYGPEEPVEGTSFESTDAAPGLDQEQQGPNEPTPQSRALPAWFKQDAPERSHSNRESRHPSEHSTLDASIAESSVLFSTPDLSSYSDAHDPSETLEPIYRDHDGNAFRERIGSEGSDPTEANEEEYESNPDTRDSISDRLSRMLADAGQRRPPAHLGDTPKTSQSWSQKFNSPSAESAMEIDSSDSRNDLPDYRDTRRSDTFDEAMASSSEPTAEQQQYDVSESDGLRSENDRAGQERYRESSVSAYSDELIDQETTSSHSESDSELPRSSEEEESIEDYMQRLLNRVRGEAESGPAPARANTPGGDGPGNTVQSAATKPRSRVAASLGLDMEEAPPSDDAQPSEELFLPRKQAPEKRNDLAALRELANTNARRAITRSEIRRTNSAFFTKLGVTAVAVSSSVALFLFNGVALNAPFAGMIAAIVVSMLWGFDCLNHFRRLKNAALSQATPAEIAAGQSIRVGSSDESSWRPTPA